MNGKQNTIIGFDAKRIVRNATGLGNYGRTLINNIVKADTNKLGTAGKTGSTGSDCQRNGSQKSA